MLGILWQQSSSARLVLLWRGISLLLGVEPPSGGFAHAPNFLYWKKHWTINPHSAFPDCSGPYKHPAWLCQFRLGALICSAIPVSLCTWGFELPLALRSPLFQLCSLLFQTGNQSCTQGTWVLCCPDAVCCFGLYSFLNYTTCFSDLCWTLGWHFQVFLCDNLKIFSLCGNSQLTDQYV